MKQGQIITLQKNQYIVKSDDLKVSCVIRGKIRQQQLLPRVGDFVLFDENKKVIEKILPRKNSFLRPSSGTHTRTGFSRTATFL